MLRSIASALVLGLAGVSAHAGGGPENVLVVVNELSPDSLEIGRYYRWRRDIPRHHVVHVRVPGMPVESFRTWEDYRTLLEDPVRSWIARHPESRITIIVLTRGIPVVAPAKNARDGDVVRSTAHLLAGLAIERDDLRTGEPGFRGRPSPFHRADASLDPAEPLREGLPLYGVGFLDAFSVEDVKRMIDRSVESDAPPAAGTVYLGRSQQGDPRGAYNGAFPALAEFVGGLGLKAEIVPHAPKGSLLEGKRDVLGYAFGQADWDPAFPAKNRFLPGAVVDNLTSFALTWKAFDPAHKGGQTPVTHFLAAGATVVHGCVREPTTGAWDPEYVHLKRYLSGYNVIESFIMGHPWFPWMNLVAGDPLTQPFARRPAVAAELAGTKGAYRLKATAQAAREGASIRRLSVYVDGARAGETAGGEFALPRSFDPAVNAWKVVAEDDTKYRAQGSAGGAPPKPEADRVAVKLAGSARGKATFRLTGAGAEPVVTWVAPGAREETGTLRGRAFSVTYEDAGPHAVEVWIRNTKSGPTVLTVEVPRASR